MGEMPNWCQVFIPCGLRYRKSIEESLFLPSPTVNIQNSNKATYQHQLCLILESNWLTGDEILPHVHLYNVVM